MPFPEHPITDDLRRRDFLGILAGAALLTACGSGSEPEASGGRTKSFEHSAGTTEVPVSPQRVVSLGSTYVTWQLATLGVLSVGTTAAPLDDPAVYIRAVDPQAAEALDGLVSVGDAEVDVERVAALRPDLIVGGDFHQDIYDELSAIAPTVLIASDLPNGRFFGVQGALADLTGTTKRLEQLHAAYDERVAGLREKHADRWADLDWLTLDDYESGGGAFIVNLTKDTPGFRVLDDLGARLSAPAQRYAEGEQYVELSSELVTGLDADVVFVAAPYLVLAEDPQAPVADDTAALLRTSAASRAGQVLPVGLGWTNTNVASLQIVLDDLERFLQERPDGFFDTSFGDA